MTSVWTAVTRVPRMLGVGLIRLYRLTLSPFLGRQCRYLPTCSSYTEEAIGRYGLWAGSGSGSRGFSAVAPSARPGSTRCRTSCRPTPRGTCRGGTAAGPARISTRKTRLDLKN